jgi:F-type H+-transporting ATPase subunit gamma
MASFREIKRRIGSVRNIQQITRAMKMVAAARLLRAEEAIRGMRPYSSHLDHLCARFLHGATGGEHPFFEERLVRAVAILVVASDRGLCGAYNNKVTEAARRLVESNRGRSCRLVAVGARAVAGLTRSGLPPCSQYTDVFNPVRYVTALALTAELQRMFLSREADEVHMVFTEFFSPMRQAVVTRRVLPCHPEAHPREVEEHHVRPLPEGMHAEPGSISEAEDAAYVYEPDYEALGNRLLEHNLSTQVYRALLEAQASEHGARMVAMDSATENAEEMVEELTLHMNRLRQESITREMLDVVGGAEALR